MGSLLTGVHGVTPLSERAEGGLYCITDVRPLIVEDTERIITEMVDPQDGKKKTAKAMRVTGIFQEAEISNANSRIYPKTVLESAVKKIAPLVKKRQVLGEFDHPPDAKIHLDRVSHLITDLWMEGNKVMGKAEILEWTPFGQQLKGLLEQEVTIGVSSRGVGDMESHMSEGKQFFKVLDGYHLITFDAVAEPSVPGTELSVMESLNRNRMIHHKKDGALVKKHKQYRLVEALKRSFK